jgi:fucose 4-O-acetylase-like acetyltransferase
MQEENRNTTVSIVKGIAIIAVVVGHCACYAGINTFINQWHLAAFFFVAGFCFKEKYVDTPIEYIRRRFKSLYLPFVKFGVFFILAHNLFWLISFEPTYWDFGQTWKELYKLVFKLNIDDEQLLGAMWFCPILLISSISMMFVLKFSPRNRHIGWNILFSSLVFAIASYALSLHLWSPYGLWQCLVLSFMMINAFWFRKSLKNERIRHLLSDNRYVNISIFTVGTLILYITYRYGFLAALQSGTIPYENCVALLIIPTVGGFTVFSLASLVKDMRNMKWLIYVGDHSMSIMALNILAFKMVGVIVCAVYSLPWSENTVFQHMSYTHGNYWMWVYLVAGVGIPLLCDKIYRKIRK